MRLRELFAETNDPVEIEEISVLLSVEAFNTCGLEVALESVWQDSGHKDYVLRVDPENPDIPLKRHVHIARKKHTASKNMQASWNADGTRHDKKYFNTKIGERNRVREIARNALNIPPDVALESWGENASIKELLEEDVSVEKSGKIAYLRIDLA